MCPTPRLVPGFLLAPLQHAPASVGWLRQRRVCTAPHMSRFAELEKTTQQMFSASTLSAGTTCSVFLVSIPQSGAKQAKLHEIQCLGYL